MSRCQALIFKQNKFGWVTDERVRCRKSQKVTIENHIGFTVYVHVCNDDRCHQAVYNGHFVK